MAVGYVELGDMKLCRSQELEAGLQVLAGTPRSESCKWGPVAVLGVKNILLQLL